MSSLLAIGQERFLGAILRGREAYSWTIFTGIDLCESRTSVFRSRTRRRQIVGVPVIIHVPVIMRVSCADFRVNLKNEVNIETLLRELGELRAEVKTNGSSILHQ